jgi:hypothetical protein
MKQFVDNSLDGCPPLSFKVKEHIQYEVSGIVLWDTVLESYNQPGVTIRARGKYCSIGDKIDYTGTTFVED